MKTVSRPFHTHAAMRGGDDHHQPDARPREEDVENPVDALPHPDDPRRSRRPAIATATTVAGTIGRPRPASPAVRTGASQPADQDSAEKSERGDVGAHTPPNGAAAKNATFRDSADFRVDFQLAGAGAGAAARQVAG